MHKEVREFIEEMKEIFPHFFRNRVVLDVGSIDINGTNKQYFKNCNYTGIDLIEGSNVDKVCECHNMTGEFDMIISTEAFEHDKYLNLSLKNICKMLTSGGLFLFTCATNGRCEHGTSKVLPEDSASSQIEGWEDYYKNVTREMVEPVIKDYFREYYFNTLGTNLQFWGIRNNKEVI